MNLGKAISILIFLIGVSAFESCNSPAISLSAEVYRVDGPFLSDSSACVNRGELPKLRFFLELKNVGNKSVIVNIRDYGRNENVKSGTFWLFPNNGIDSIALFSGSCEHCIEDLSLNPNDSIQLILQTEYANLAVGRDGTELDIEYMENFLEKVRKEWSEIKYFDTDGSLLLEARNTVGRGT